MKRFALAVLASGIALAALAAPSFVTPRMRLRNGLTDAQYERLWSLGKNPSVTRETARDWMYKSFRYGNTTNWLDICGRTNDFAKLSFVLQDRNFVLEETNGVLVATNRYLSSEVRSLEPDAKSLRKAAKAAEKAAEKDAKNYTKWIDDTEKLKRKSSADFAGFLDEMIRIATNAVPIPPNGK